MPSSPAQSLQLTGRYLYTQVRTIPDRYFIIHLYVARQDDSVLDISITNLFKDSKLVTLPLIVAAGEASCRACVSVFVCMRVRSLRRHKPAGSWAVS